MKSREILKKIAPYTWAAVVLAVLNLAWVFGNRFSAQREMERAYERRQVEAYKDFAAGEGTGVRITQFYASTGELSKGEQAIVCYGVQNATGVRIDPPVEDLKPAMNRCFGVTPDRTTTYTLVAQGPEGAQAAESFTVKVNPAPPYILFVAISDREIRRGDPFTMCYGVKNASGVRLDPLGGPLRPAEKACIKMFPLRTTDFTLTALGVDGRKDREKFRLRVK